MGLFSWNYGSVDEEHLQALAVRVVQCSLTEVLQRVTALTPQMSPAEARGYIRARAAKVVNREIAAICAAEPRLRPADRSRLVALVTDSLVATITQQRRTGRRTMAA
jgi:hypothetical protein